MRDFSLHFFNLLGVLPLILFLIKGNKNVYYLKFLFPFIILMFVASIYETVFTIMLQIGTKPWFRIYSFLEFYTLLYFYWKLLNSKRLILFFGVIYLLNYCHLIYKWIYFPRIGFNLISSDIITTSLVLVCTIIWFVDVFKKMEEKPLHINPLFYIIAALLLSYCSTFIVFVVTDYMKQFKMKIRDFYQIVIYAGVILRGTFVIILCKSFKTKV